MQHVPHGETQSGWAVYVFQNSASLGMNFSNLILSLLLSIMCEAKLLKMFNDSTLVAPKTPVILFNNSFVSYQQVNLLLSNKFKVVGQFYNVTDAVTNQTIFRMSAPFLSSRNVRTLQHVNKEPICNLQNNYTTYIRQRLYAGNDTDELVATFKQSFGMFRLKVTIQGTNLYNNEPFKMFLVGDWFVQGDAEIYLKSPKGGRILVGRLKFRETNKQMVGKRDFIITAAPNVDVALIVMIAASFDSSFDKFTFPKFVHTRW